MTKKQLDYYSKCAGLTAVRQAYPEHLNIACFAIVRFYDSSKVSGAKLDICSKAAFTVGRVKTIHARAVSARIYLRFLPKIDLFI